MRTSVRYSRNFETKIRNTLDISRARRTQKLAHFYTNCSYNCAFQKTNNRSTVDVGRFPRPLEGKLIQQQIREPFI